MLIVFVQPFPWGDGDKSLIHNPKTNPCPPVEGGTEEDVTDKPVSFWLTKYVAINLVPGILHSTHLLNGFLLT